MLKPKPQTETVEPAALSPGGAARFLSVTSRKIYLLIAEGELTARKLGSRTLIDFKSIKKYYDALPPMVTGARIPNAPKRKARR
jgi:excisionase family DNA binding protein